MKAARFTDAQKAFVLKQVEEGKTVAEVCLEAGISSATYFTGRSMRKCCPLTCAAFENRRAQTVV